MEKYLPIATRTDINEEEVQILCNEIFHRHITHPITDLKVLQLVEQMSPEYRESETGYHILAIKDLLIFFKLDQ